jgi:hypothetical protein
MPLYKNRTPLDAGTELRRHMPLVALEELLRDRRLRLARIDQFHDPFEGSVPKQQIDDQMPIFSSWNAMQSTYAQLAAHYPELEVPRRPYRDPWEMMTMRRKALTRSAHASCWTSGPESEGMWRLYCEDDDVRGQGVAIRSTLAKVEASVLLHGLYVSRINYRLYHLGPVFNDHLDPLMHKRLGFQHEGEVRLLKYDEPHYLALNHALTGDHTFGPVPTVPPDLAKHIWLPWDALTVAEAITVSPYATEDYERRVRDTVAAIDPAAAALIELSVLSERRYQAYF